MSHAQGSPYHTDRLESSPSSSSLDSPPRSLTLESDRPTRSSRDSDSSFLPRHSRRYSQRRPLSPAERAVSAHYAAMESLTTNSQAPAVPQEAHEAMRVRHDALGSFFGEQLAPAPTRSSQGSHYRTHSQTRPSPRGEENGTPVPQYSSQSRGQQTRPSPALPPYESRTDVESLPVYTKEAEYDAKLNRKLFIYGFLFFPLWIVGFIAPYVKPHRDPAKDNRSKEAQDAEDANMRTIELKWSRRCGTALVTLFLLVIIVVIIAVVASGH